MWRRLLMQWSSRGKKVLVPVVRDVASLGLTRKHRVIICPGRWSGRGWCRWWGTRGTEWGERKLWWRWHGNDDYDMAMVIMTWISQLYGGEAETCFTGCPLHLTITLLPTTFSATFPPTALSEISLKSNRGRGHEWSAAHKDCWPRLAKCFLFPSQISWFLCNGVPTEYL